MTSVSDKTSCLSTLELYSGIGGMHYASELSGCDTKVIFSVDINDSANEVYRHNFPNTNQQSRNIGSLTAHEINKLGPKIVMMSPPCQPFTRVGLKMDVKDPRCSSFLHFLEILPNLKTVEFILMENVVGFENSEMKNTFTETLGLCHFHYREFILSPECLNIPNSRSRYYLLARKIKDFAFGSKNEISTEFPANYRPNVSTIAKTLQSYLEDLGEEELSRYLLSDRTLSKYWRVLDIRQKTDSSSNCFTKAYSHYAEGTGSIFQHCNGQLPTLSSALPEDEILAQLKLLKLRYFTPREVLNLMGFPSSFRFPDNISLKTRYRLLGNSLNVLVVSNLLRLLLTIANDKE